VKAPKPGLFFVAIFTILLLANPLLAVPDKSLYQVAPFMSAYRAIPNILLVLSKDLKMFQQAYNELLDMDGDGRIDTGFNPKVNYYGYYDSYSCYKYVGNVNRDGDSRGISFEPARPSRIKSKTSWTG
jgi:type IV pilus assembly protein PilY1